jgi:hypothetical protein
VRGPTTVPTPTSTTRLHFSRFEFKYVLAPALRREVEAALAHFVELDPNVLHRPDHEYFVRSLYFDDAALSSFHDKTDGMHTRSKFRVRTYTRTLADPAPWFLEIKGRYNNLVFKHRTPIEGDFDPQCAGDALSRTVLRCAAPGAVRSQFEFELYRKRLQPTALVDYRRRPYLSRFDPEFRLTFDSDLETCWTDAMFAPRRRAMRRVLPGRTVMEVKFRHHVPSWFHSIIQAFELRRVSVSKICAGTEALGLAFDPS